MLHRFNLVSLLGIEYLLGESLPTNERLTKGDVLAILLRPYLKDGAFIMISPGVRLNLQVWQEAGFTLVENNPASNNLAYFEFQFHAPTKT